MRIDIPRETLRIALRNMKVRAGIAVLASLLLLALLGPHLTPYSPLEYTGEPSAPPSLRHPLGTNMFGYDVFSQTVHGLRLSLLVGLIGGALATAVGVVIGFAAGYAGGLVDEALMVLTNILLVIPTLALLIVIAAYLPYRGVAVEGVIIGLTAWPWTARAIRAQTLALRQRDFVLVARMSGETPLEVVLGEIAPNMFSYIFMVFILQFGGAILNAVGLDFIGLGPTRGVSLGIILQQAVLWNAIQLGLWWWAIPPGFIIALLLTSLYVVNTGLDEVFNPRLRGG